MWLLMTAHYNRKFRAAARGRRRGPAPRGRWHNRPAMRTPPPASLPDSAPGATSWWRDAAALLLCLAAAGAVSLRWGQDANWDLQNYHFYNPWALLTGRLDRDIAAAQLQTYLNPLADVPFYLMVAADWPPRLIAVALALPAGAGAWLLLKCLLILFRDLAGVPRTLSIALAFAIGVSATNAVAMTGITMNEWPGAALTMAALWLLLRGTARRALSPATLLAAGLAAGLKLTAATFAVGLAAALLLRRPVGRRGLVDAAWFGGGVLGGVALGGGYWMWMLWTRFDNPVFPYFNTVFQSPWWVVAPVPQWYGPKTPLDWITFPLRLFAATEGLVGEIRFRDWRLPVLYLLALALGVRWLVRAWHAGRGAPHAPDLPADVAATWQFVGIFWGASFAVWYALHSIYRYLIPLELLTGALMLVALRLLVPVRALPWTAVAVTLLVTVSARYPDWWHVPFGARWFDVRVPYVAPNALVLMVSNAPMAYVLPYLPADARFVGVDNNVSSPRDRTRMQAAIAALLEQHRGPAYSLAFPAGAGSASLAAYGLRRVPDECADVRTNMRYSPLELCRLQRLPPD